MVKKVTIKIKFKCKYCGKIVTKKITQDGAFGLNAFRTGDSEKEGCTHIWSIHKVEIENAQKE